MDFPKSVPGVGLVDGKFADEDAALGRQGSLIPAAWGNAVTGELLNVIEAAGLEPDEAQTDQLLAAIRALVPERSAFARITGAATLPASAFGIYALDATAAATVTLPSLAELPSDTELLLFAGHANAAAVQVKAVTGQAIQGPADLMDGGTAAFMLPAAGDWVRLRSEKAQGRWVVVAASAGSATATRAGLVELATNAEVAAGTDTTRAITPAGLKSHLGTAATRNVGAANGNLMEVGAFGLGAAIPPLIANLNDDLVASGIYRCNDSSTGPRPDGFSLYGMILVMRFSNSTDLSQIYINLSADGKIAFRARTPSEGWGPWREIYHSGNLQIPLGQWQTWQDVKSSRSIGTTYTNTTGRAIQLSICLRDNTDNSQISLYIDGILVSTQGGVGNVVVFSNYEHIIPAGSTYRVEYTSGASGVSIDKWWELR
ncbi:hypothetical protein [Comamonas aquatica]|uniref:Phage tail protein n=1 Tax=Comamonas aquatica TaxID=225991 RepID=A0AA42HW51_9BURK|nr:hypothetical protein [Comamonas aquatica]MDH0362782.1 hypothetical protein [Comamonas aquatica]